MIQCHVRQASATGDVQLTQHTVVAKVCVRRLEV